MRPTLRQLEYLVAVAEHLNFRRAAEQCAVTQPALSSQIAQLEKTLGVSLLERDRRRVLLTAAGEAQVSRAREILSRVDDAIQAARTHKEPLAGQLSLGVIPTVAPYLLPRSLPALHAHYPKLKLRLREDHTERLVESTLRGELDVLVLALEADLGELETMPLFEDPFRLAVPAGHPVAKRKTARETDLAGEPVLYLDDGH